MAKIKITEDQAKRLKLINENTEPVIKFETFCEKLNAEIDKLYLNVTNLSVSDILSNNPNINTLQGILNNYDDYLYSNKMKAQNFINSLPEDQLHSLDLRIDNVNSKVSNKISSLSIILSDLEKLQTANETHDLSGQFKNVKPMDISNIQS